MEELNTESRSITNLNENINLLGSAINTYASKVATIISNLKAGQTANIGAIASTQETQIKLKENLAETERKSASLESQLIEKTNEVEKITQTLKEQTQESKTQIGLLKDMSKETEDSKKVLLDNIAQMERSIKEVRQTNTQLSTENAKLKKTEAEVIALREQLETIAADNARKQEIDNSITNLNVQIGVLEKNLEAKQKDLDEEMGRIKQIEEDYKQKLELLTKELAASKESKENNQAAITELKDHNNKIGTELQNLSDTIDAQNKTIMELESLRDEKDTIRIANDKCIEKISALENEIAASAEKIAKLQKQVDELTTTLDIENPEEDAKVVASTYGYNTSASAQETSAIVGVDDAEVANNNDNNNEPPVVQPQMIQLIKYNYKPKTDKNAEIVEFPLSDKNPEMPADTSEYTWAEGFVDIKGKLQQIKKNRQETEIQKTIKMDGKDVPAFTKKILENGEVVNVIYYYKYEPDADRTIAELQEEQSSARIAQPETVSDGEGDGELAKLTKKLLDTPVVDRRKLPPAVTVADQFKPSSGNELKVNKRKVKNYDADNIDDMVGGKKTKAKSQKKHKTHKSRKPQKTNKHQKTNKRRKTHKRRNNKTTKRH